jgi:phosphate transport system substrate-binding protein
MPHTALASAFAASLLVLSSLAQAAPFIIRGSTTVANMIITPHLAEIEQDSGLTLDVIANGSGRGLADLDQGKVESSLINLQRLADTA